MRQPLILDFFSLLPERTVDAEPAKWAQRYRRGILKFQRAVEARYTEQTLERLSISVNPDVRRAAVLGLGLIGTMAANLPLGARLHDDDPQVCELAADALWSIWFRADSPENNRELQRLMRLDVTPKTADEVLAEFQALIRRAPRFAEAYNQRAIVHFRLDEFGKAVLDCEKALRMNPVHFGAAGGMAQCFMRQRKLRAALRCFRRAFRINPNLDGVPEAIQSIEKTLGDDGKR